jgi:hypothetical protein
MLGSVRLEIQLCYFGQNPFLFPPERQAKANFQEVREFGQLPWNVRFVPAREAWRIGLFAPYGFPKTPAVAAGTTAGLGAVGPLN